MGNEPFRDTPERARNPIFCMIRFIELRRRELGLCAGPWEASCGEGIPGHAGTHREAHLARTDLPEQTCQTSRPQKV